MKLSANGSTKSGQFHGKKSPKLTTKQLRPISPLKLISPVQQTSIFFSRDYARLYVAKFLIANKPKDIEFAEAELAEAGKREAKGKAAEQRRQVLMKIIEGLEGDVGGVVAQISSAATQMQSAAQTMSAIAEETSSQSATVAAASKGSAPNVQTVASSTEDLSSSILEITHQVTESSRIS